MKIIQIYFIYVWDTVIGWRKCSKHINPENGFEYEESASTHLITLISGYPEKEFTIMSVWKSILSIDTESIINVGL